MTQRVKKSVPPDTGSLYQLPPGIQWWLCRYSDHGHVSEMLFTHENVKTWYDARAMAHLELTILGLDPKASVVTLYVPN